MKRKYREAMRAAARERDAVETRDWYDEFAETHVDNAGTVSAERKEDVHSTRSSSSLETGWSVQHS